MQDFGFRISTHPRRNHEDTKTLRNHEGHPPALWNAEAQRRRAHPPVPSRKDAAPSPESSAMWRGLRPSDGRRPPGRDSVSNPSARPGVPPHRPALSESAGLATSHLHSRGWRLDHPHDSRQAGRKANPSRRFSPLFKRMEKGPSLRQTMGRARGRTAVPRARRPVRSAATTNARVRSSPASHRRQAIRSPAVLPPRDRRAPLPAPAPLRLCAFAPLRSIGRVGGLRDFLVPWCLRGRDVGGWAALRLCASAPLRFRVGGWPSWIPWRPWRLGGECSDQ